MLVPNQTTEKVAQSRFYFRQISLQHIRIPKSMGRRQTISLPPGVCAMKINGSDKHFTVKPLALQLELMLEKRELRLQLDKIRSWIMKIPREGGRETTGKIFALIRPFLPAFSAKDIHVHLCEAQGTGITSNTEFCRWIEFIDRTVAPTHWSPYYTYGTDRRPMNKIEKSYAKMEYRDWLYDVRRSKVSVCTNIDIE
ncbi:hypothetical protein SARC_12114 [Sphaeroforma arctica JP610]|uniref:Uncharacterized protein n=1 Tax=Sphaeroforma arctica JP610 TaxID=667725 RepID=A0A0L0FH23_9EUKA|nr:hypothetical protein SARC_12114 [Sphaeroforma arctica JP610]KNC75358.1 hypothetical protein SARC_12114 [Sphaeroforma arctica JP610]|eukprot:XP_014149260.1 hypothetical protein SARC_12114 [Sphaeroforma arctica JP610]